MIQQFTRSTLSLILLSFATLFAEAAEIHEAAHAGDIAKVKNILRSDPSAARARDEWQSTPLDWAGPDKAMTELLLQYGGDPNARDRDGRTPLFYGVPGETAKLLIDAGADVDTKDYEGNTP